MIMKKCCSVELYEPSVCAIGYIPLFTLVAFVIVLYFYRWSYIKVVQQLHST